MSTMAAEGGNLLYQSLEESPPTIRLFTLYPAATLHAPLQGHLETVPLDSPPPYEALSYAWGHGDGNNPSRRATKIISIDGHDFFGTPNLDAALRGLRSEDVPRVLWVDAICINQQSVPERSHQVSLMEVIYSNCTRDLLWLGPMPYSGEGYHPAGEDTLVKGLQLMGRIADKDITTLGPMEQKYVEYESKSKKWGHMWNYNHDENGDNEQGMETIPLPTEVIPSRKRMLLPEEQGDLEMAMNYAEVWKRLWVMQELALAPRIQLVAGRQTLDWELLTQFLGDTPYADAFHRTFSHGFVDTMVSQTFRRAQTIDHQRRLVRDMRAGKAESSLLDVLARFRSSKSSDPRDKVYGLLSLVSEHLRLGVRPNYGKEPAQVYAHVTAAIINHAGNLDIICQSPWRSFEEHEETGVAYYRKQEPDLVGELPSWAADFRVDGQVHLFAQRSIFNAGRPNCEIPCRVLDDIVLVTKGVAIGRVGPIRQKDHANTKLQDIMQKRWARRSYLPLHWLVLCLGRDVLDQAEQPREQHRYITGESAFTAYWRTLIIDCVAFPMKRLSAEQIDEHDLKFRKRWPQLLQDWEAKEEHGYDDGGEPFPEKGMERMWDRLFDRWTFSVTDNGLYVMIMPPTREGDIVACLDGGKVPVVLRPVEHDGAGERYRIIGVAYVHGFMDMEATASKALIEKLRLEEKEFWLL